MPGFSRVFFLVVVVVTWLPDVTEGHVTPVGSVHGVFSTTSASYNPRKPRVLYLVTGTSLGYLALLFSYSVYIGCVVLC